MKSGPWGRPWNPYGRLGLGSWTWSLFHSGSLPGTGKSPHPGSQWPAGGGSRWGGLEPHYPRDLPGEIGPSKLLSGLCSGDRGEGPKQCKSFEKGLMRQGSGQGVTGDPLTNFHSSCWGGFLGAPLQFSTSGFPIWAVRFRLPTAAPGRQHQGGGAGKRDGADKTSTGCVREPEEWYPGSRKVLGRFGEGAECFQKGG